MKRINARGGGLYPFDIAIKPAENAIVRRPRRDAASGIDEIIDFHLQHAAVIPQRLRHLERKGRICALMPPHLFPVHTNCGPFRRAAKPHEGSTSDRIRRQLTTVNNAPSCIAGRIRRLVRTGAQPIRTVNGVPRVRDTDALAICRPARARKRNDAAVFASRHRGTRDPRRQDNSQKQTRSFQCINSLISGRLGCGLEKSAFRPRRCRDSHSKPAG